MGLVFDLTLHIDKVQAALKENVNKALEECGIVAEGYAKDLCPVNTGNLRNSIRKSEYFCTNYIPKPIRE